MSESNKLPTGDASDAGQQSEEDEIMISAGEEEKANSKPEEKQQNANNNGNFISNAIGAGGDGATSTTGTPAAANNAANGLADEAGPSNSNVAAAMGSNSENDNGNQSKPDGLEISSNGSARTSTRSNDINRGHNSPNYPAHVPYDPRLDNYRHSLENDDDSDDEYISPLPNVAPATANDTPTITATRRYQRGSIAERDYWLENTPRNSYDRAVASIAIAAANDNAVDAVPAEPAPPAPATVPRRVTRSTTRNYRTLRSALASYSDSSPEPGAAENERGGAAPENERARDPIISADAENSLPWPVFEVASPALDMRRFGGRVRLTGEAVYSIVPTSSPSSASDTTTSGESITGTGESSTTTDEEVDHEEEEEEDEDTNENDADDYDDDNEAEQLDLEDGSNVFMESDDFEVNVDITEDLNEIMNKPKPIFQFNLTSELMRRERGFSSTSRYAPYNPIYTNFHSNFYASRYAIERMSCSGYLRRHTGCVNSLNFNGTGDLLVSGSDDTRIVIWNWQKTAVKHCFKSGHLRNIFQTKFINVAGDLDIVSSSLDGEVRRSILAPGAEEPIIKALYTHGGAVHKLCISPHSQYEIISAGEDGVLKHKDIRIDGDAEQMCTIKRRDVTISLYSVDHHPYVPEICVSGTDNYVRVYDKRKMDCTVREMCPKHLTNKVGFMITSAVYNYDGSEVLASYGDEHIYLFNNIHYVPGDYLHRYRGHLNQQTIKGVNFFGPRSEYVISGSDCGHLFFWDKQTEAIINYVRGDTSGVVNCLEPHPSIPVLAVSGLDRSVKLMSPCNNKNPPDLSKLQALVKGNLKRGINGNTPGWDRRLFTYIMRQMLRRNELAFGGYDDDGAGSASGGSSYNESSRNANAGLAVLAEARRRRRNATMRGLVGDDVRSDGGESDGRQNGGGGGSSHRIQIPTSDPGAMTSELAMAITPENALNAAIEANRSPWTAAWASASSLSSSSAALLAGDNRPSGSGSSTSGGGGPRTRGGRTASSNAAAISELSELDRSIDSLLRHNDSADRIPIANARTRRGVARITIRGAAQRGVARITIRGQGSQRVSGGSNGRNGSSTTTASSGSGSSNAATEDEQLPTGRRRRGHLDDDGPE